MSDKYSGLIKGDFGHRLAAYGLDPSSAAGAKKVLEEELFKRRGGGGGGQSPTSGKSRPLLKHGARSETEGDGSRAAPRRLAERLEAVAKGSQPAVVKMASYGGGGRLGAMVDYVSRKGEIAIETESGERLRSRGELAALKKEWEPLFQNRAESRDIASFSVRIDTDSIKSEDDLHDAVRQVLVSGFGHRRYAYSVEQPARGVLDVQGVLVLRSKEGERLTGDEVAAEIVQGRFDKNATSKGAASGFSFSRYGNGVEYGTARVRDLVEANGEVRDDRGRVIETDKAAGDLVQKEWRSELHSRKGRDVMHVILSARAGTNADAFESAARDFLAHQFEGFKYAFSMHDPMHDPKEQSEGGKRPHIHVHALVVMRNHDGERVETSPQIFRQWRALLAEKARDHGIAMEMTDRREMASSPAFTRNQVRATDTTGRTVHVGTSPAAQMRYDNKRAEARTVATTEQSLQHAFDAKRAWSSVADRSDDEKVVQFALSAEAKLSFAIRSSLEGLAVSVERGEFDTVKDAARQHLADIVREGEVMSDDMTRAQFDAYEKNVASALANYGELIDQEEKEQFSLISERAQNIVDARRKVVELQEELEDLRSKTRPNSIVRDVASSIATFSPVARVLEVVEEAVKEGVAAVETNIKEGISAVEANVKQSLEPAPSASAEKGGVEEPKPSRSLPAEITSQYFLQHAADGAVRVFTNSKATREVFQDAGEKLRSKIYDPTAVRLMIDTAAHRGWTSVEIAGSKEFRREAWLEGQARGIAVKGYQPNELDWQEVGRREQSHLKNEIRHIEEKLVAAESKAEAKPVKGEAAVEKVAAATASTKNRTGFREGVSGELVEIGSKPYQDKPENEASPYVVLRTAEGDRTVWGVGIPAALSHADAKEGDTITLKEAGMEKVEKTVIREVEGRKVREVEMVDRRKWEAEVVTARDDKTAEVETSSDQRLVIEEKAAVREGEASQSEPSARQLNRLEELMKERDAKRDRDDQER
ncbi:relaxase [Agrobacterium genomosp. 3]|uniref:LPD7 domain-containing protein n=1 Tax=Agrobacterium tomkonis TaxID=1183410 RepID=UPI001CD89BCE|nr:relaxase [Agrobacterium tomkonis]MCA1878836.1 relaxase [Agrobacterium tumefaciens]MCA1894082.1 relaxase [Agrobacterium tomkonis]